MTPTTRAVMTPLLIVFLMVIVVMWFFQIAPLAVSLGAALVCLAGLGFLAITKKREHEAKRNIRNHRRGHAKS
ncbi:hypothetical protein JYT11_00130 [Planctomycetaceae bacterium AH-315-I19]|nr:hypothetical protein [Planctomycetaceae bacterium AH-315-I19]